GLAAQVAQRLICLERLPEMRLGLFILAYININPGERRPRYRLAVAILQGLHLRGGLTVITNRVEVIAERLITQAAPIDRHRLFIAFAETLQGRGGPSELFDGLTQRVRRFANAQLFALADGVFGLNAPPVDSRRLSQLSRGYNVTCGRRELKRGPHFDQIIARRFGDHRNGLPPVCAIGTINPRNSAARRIQDSHSYINALLRDCDTQI